MPRGRITAALRRQCRHYANATRGQQVPILLDATLETFRREAFEPATPALLPRGYYASLPAISKWFTRPPGHTSLTLNASYLATFGSTVVPIEITNNDQFSRLEQSLSFFLECVKASTSSFQPKPNRYFTSYTPNARAVKHKRKAQGPNESFFTSASSITAPTARVYLAQAPLADLPKALTADVPTPAIVLEAGKGDVYDSSIWLGRAPTYTPLHRDPNPNLFVQLAGRKVVRLMRPEVGSGVFAKVQERIGGRGSANLRGEEMMMGEEKMVLEEEVWGKKNDEKGGHLAFWEVEMGCGDALFIPKGYWHSIKGVGEGMIGSVNWWFR